MRHGNRIAGPAMIEQETTAIFVSDAFDCVVDALGSFALFRKGREDLCRSGFSPTTATEPSTVSG
jgi:N-methylhydantoinase A